MAVDGADNLPAAARALKRLDREQFTPRAERALALHVWRERYALSHGRAAWMVQERIGFLQWLRLSRPERVEFMKICKKALRDALAARGTSILL